VSDPFLRLMAAFADHPKVVGLSDAAFRLHVCGMLHCARYRTNGQISPDARLKFGRNRCRVNELIDAGLWMTLGDDGYVIHDYLQWNYSKEELKSRSQAKAKAGRKGADARWKS
jgi:hypothetical protein